ncbi:glycosyltransferase family 39 protein [Iningainema tapete]|uniref:Glycosyltransferase family 39 protein n=1 Tax=Iningainema tapete BLCC-T55 TaxID=2748662 RepID=A0A8J7C8W2_9CYAN|nr:glycosyltransferase family 39 protein [Iningainema tapete]MBD2775216.1 glycosyltransferase family 39 protein [Iningainema tapete BLCC-T55]
MFPAFSKNDWLHLLLLLIWTLLGLGLRFTNLMEKPLWADEFSTIVFSLGNSFLSVPLDEALTAQQLLSPLVPNPQANIRAVVDHLFDESNHPPLYFILSHFWFKLFPTEDGLVTALWARSLSALFGTMTIGATFVLARMAFRSSVVGQIAAAFMAVSPFGIYLAQEARHYTLAILWAIVSLYCMVRAAQTIHNRIPLPLSICVIWIVANALGVATHFFFCLTLAAEAISMGSLGLREWRRGINLYAVYWQRIWAVAAGTFVTCLVWIPLLPKLSNNELTHWIYKGSRSGLDWLDPILQAIAGWITMLYLLPIQSESRLVAIVSGILLIVLAIWTIPKLWRGLKQLYNRDEERFTVYVLVSFVGAAIFLFFAIVYFGSIDLTKAFRYNFVYFHAVIVLVGGGLASAWNDTTKIVQSQIHWLRLFSISGRQTVILIWLVSLLGGLSVVTNLGYQKTHRPDVVAATIRQESQGTVLIAIPHYHHGQTGRLMGIALQLQQNKCEGKPLNPLFLLAHQTQNPLSALTTLNQSLTQLPHPLDLWLVNFQQVPEQPLNTLLVQQSCATSDQAHSIDGYRYQLYHCF